MRKILHILFNRKYVDEKVELLRQDIKISEEKIELRLDAFDEKITHIENTINSIFGGTVYINNRISYIERCIDESLDRPKEIDENNTSAAINKILDIRLDQLESRIFMAIAKMK